MIPLSGPRSRAFVTLRFEPHPSQRAELTLPHPLELNPELPIPSVGETVAVRDEQGEASRFEVLAKRLAYQSESRCVVTLVVGRAPGSSSNPR